MTTEPRPDQLLERSGRALASPLRLTLNPRAGSGGTHGTLGADGADGARDALRADRIADEAWAEVVAVFAEVDRAMSRFRDDSELTGLARRAGEATAGVSRALMSGLVAADRARRVTDGRFDPRIVGALERIGYAGVPQGPTGSEPDPTTRTDPTTRIVEREGRSGTVTLPVPVDLGGIGKGLALRWAVRRLERCLKGAVSGFLLDAGGDIVAGGVGPDGGPWKVGIEDPTGQPEPLAVMVIEGRGAVATSSTRRLQWVEGDRVLHHLIDPRTGEPGGEGLRAVTVAGSDPAWAEVWAKALFLEGQGGIAAAARRRGLAAWWATEDGRFEMTAAARVRTIWVAGES